MYKIAPVPAPANRIPIEIPVPPLKDDDGDSKNNIKSKYCRVVPPPCCTM